MTDHIDVRIQKTKASIYQAFEEMICAEDFEKITIKGLSEKAGIHRKTFYLHYDSIDELYEEVLSSITQQYAAEVAKLPLPLNYFDLTRVMFQFFSGTPYVETLFCEPRFHALATRLMAKTMAFNRNRNNPFQQFPKEMQNIINSFVTTASVSAFRQWIADGKVVPMDDAIQMVGTLLEDGVSAITSRP